MDNNNIKDGKERKIPLLRGFTSNIIHGVPIVYYLLGRMRRKDPRVSLWAFGILNSRTKRNLYLGFWILLRTYPYVLIGLIDGASMRSKA